MFRRPRRRPTVFLTLVEFTFIIHDDDAGCGDQESSHDDEDDYRVLPVYHNGRRHGSRNVISEEDYCDLYDDLDEDCFRRVCNHVLTTACVMATICNLGTKSRRESRCSDGRISKLLGKMRTGDVG